MKLLLLVVIVATFVSCGYSQTDSPYGPLHRLIRTAVLSGSQEVPPVVSPGSSGVGYCVTTDNPSSNAGGGQLYCEVIINSPNNITEVHLHIAPPGVAGARVQAFTLGAARGIWTAETYLNASFLNTYSNGGMYFNVHSVEFSAGEMRGQLTAENDVVAGLSNFGQTNDQGILVGNYNPATRLLGATLQHSIAKGAKNAQLLFGKTKFPFSSSSSPTSGIFTLSDNEQNSLFAVTALAQVSEEDDDVLEGTLAVIDPVPRATFGARLQSDQNGTAVGCAIFTTYCTGQFYVTNAVEYLVVHNLVGAQGSYVTTGTRTQVLFSARGPSPIYGFYADKPTTDVVYEFTHNTEKSDSETRVVVYVDSLNSISGQVSTKYQYFSYLGGVQENPPVTASNIGCALLIVSGNNLDLQLVHDVSDANGASLNSGNLGVSGIALVTFTNATSPVNYNGTFSSVSSLKGGSYLNVVNPAFPNGIIRGQIYPLRNSDKDCKPSPFDSQYYGTPTGTVDDSGYRTTYFYYYKSYYYYFYNYYYSIYHEKKFQPYLPDPLKNNPLANISDPVLRIKTPVVGSASDYHPSWVLAVVTGLIVILISLF